MLTYCLSFALPSITLPYLQLFVSISVLKYFSFFDQEVTVSWKTIALLGHVRMALRAPRWRTATSVIVPKASRELPVRRISTSVSCIPVSTASASTRTAHIRK